MQYLKADTITEVTVGPAVAVGDGFTPVTSLVGTSADEFEIIKHGATATTTIAGTLAAITGADGYYALDLSATDTNTEGRLTLLINDDSLILPIRLEFMVVAANVFDALFAVAGTDVLDVSVTEWIGTAAATPTVAGVPEVDITHVIGVAEDLPSNTELDARTLVAASYFDPAADTVATVTSVTNQVTADMTAISGDSVAADRLEGMMDGPIIAQVNDTSATTTAFASDGFTVATDNHFNGRLITFISGALAGQQTDITDYDAAGGPQGSQEFTVSALTEAPGDDDFFMVH